MAFLRNDAINRVNLHSGILALAQGAGGIFFLVFLLRAGVSIPVTLAHKRRFLSAASSCGPRSCRSPGAGGSNRLLIFGIVVMAAQYPLLAEVHGVGPALLALCLVSSFGEIFYWVSYNAYFAASGDAEHRGHQIGAREALVAVVGIVAPLLGAWALVTAGPRWTFAAVGVVQVLSAVPLLGAPNVTVKSRAPGAFRAARTGMLLSAIDGWFDAGFLVVWQIALFVSLHQSFSAYGSAMALAGLAGALCGPLLGRHIDAGHGRRALVVGFAAIAAIVLLRAASLGSPALAVIANALGALLGLLLLPSTTVIYNLAKASPCPMRFHMATEAGWDVGCATACLIAAALAASGTPLSSAIVLALPAVAALGLILWRFYPTRTLVHEPSRFSN